MRIGFKRIIAAAGIMVVVIGAVLIAGGTTNLTRATMHSFALTSAQAPPPEKPQMSQDVFKNVQVLRGISVDDFMGTMGLMSAALGFCCSDCHTGAGTDKVVWEADTPNKVTARRMVLMVKAINSANFAGKQDVTCWTCHRARDIPATTMTLDTVYGTPVLEPDDIVTDGHGPAVAEEILDKYIQAVGGAKKLATIKSYVAHGTSVGFAGLGGGGKVEIFAKAPDQRATYIHFTDPARGDSSRTFDGQSGWIAQPLTAVRRYQLSGGELQGARLDARLAFPAQIKTTLTGWRVGPPATIKDHLVRVVQGDGPKGLVATLYFDNVTGLLVRLVRFSNTPIGRVPTQVDYSDYRLIDGIKIPFRWTFSWLDGQDAFQLTDVRPNVPIDAAKFGIPPVPAASAQ